MTSRTLDLSITSKGIMQTQAEMAEQFDNNFNYGGIHQKAMMSDMVKVNGDDFVIISLNGKSPVWNGNEKLNAPKKVNLELYQKGEEVNMGESVFATFVLSALIPSGTLLSHMVHVKEGLDYAQEGNGLFMNMGLKTNQTVNNKNMLDDEVPLWKRRKAEKQEQIRKEEKSKSKKVGLKGF